MKTLIQFMRTLPTAVGTILICCVNLLPAKDFHSSQADEFLGAARSLGVEAMRQNQFSIDIQNGKVDCTELWILPAQNLVLVNGQALGAEFIEKLQNGINVSQLELSNQIALLDGKMFASLPLQGRWIEVHGRRPFLGFGNSLQIDLSSIKDYALKRSFWSNAMKTARVGTAAYDEAESNLRMLDPVNGYVNYTNGSAGLKIWLNGDGRLLKSQTLQDGVVVREIQNAFIKEVPPAIVSALADLRNPAGTENDELLTALKGKESLGMFLVDSPEGLLEISWIAADGPAAKAGLKIGDLIEMINGREVKSMTKEEARGSFNSGHNFSFSVKRDGNVLLIPSVSKAILLR